MSADGDVAAVRAGTTALALDGHGSVKAFLAGRLGRLQGLMDSLLKSLGRDDKRGRQIFDDYAGFHDEPENDAAIVRLGKDSEGLLERLEPVLLDDAP